MRFEVGTSWCSAGKHFYVGSDLRLVSALKSKHTLRSVQALDSVSDLRNFKLVVALGLYQPICVTILPMVTFLSSIASQESNSGIFIVTTPTQPQLNSKVGCDMKITLVHHHHHHHPHKLNVRNITAVTDPISTKL